MLRQHENPHIYYDSLTQLTFVVGVMGCQNADNVSSSTELHADVCSDSVQGRGQHCKHKKDLGGCDGACHCKYLDRHSIQPMEWLDSPATNLASAGATSRVQLRLRFPPRS